MKTLKKEWLQLLILAAPFCAAALLWHRLPPRMAIHWDAAGRPNGYGSRAFAAWFLPCLNIGLTLLIGCLPLIDPRIRKYDPETRANMWRVTRTIRLGLSAFLMIISFLTLAIGIHMKLNITTVITFCTAALFVLLGNVMAKLRPNFFMGFRTPWTLKSKEVWTKTHRLGGKMMVLGGLALMALSLLISGEKFMWFVFMPGVAVITLVPAIYSYWCYKQLGAS